MTAKPRRTTSESCTYVDQDTECGYKRVRKAFSDSDETEYQCEEVSKEKSGSQWVTYTPVQVDTQLNVMFVHPKTTQRIATFTSHETRESKMDEDRSSACH